MPRPCVAVALMLLAAAGCSGGPAYAPVSGVVRLDGKPYDRAVVTFQPVATKDNPTPGRGSSGRTDEHGRYSLVTEGARTGALVGKHVVRITSRPADGPASDDARRRPAGDPIPPEWNGKSAREFDVPPGGTDKADFDVTSTPAVKK